MIYYFTFFLALFFAYIAKKMKNKMQLYLFMLSGLVLVIMAAIRIENVGIDTRGYVKSCYLIALNRNNIFLYLRALHVEPLYLIGTFCMAKVFGSFQAVLFFNEFIIIFFTYAAIWNLKDTIRIDISIAVFCFVFYGHSLNLTRQSMAMALVIYAFSKLIKGQQARALIFWIISIGFHYSSVVCIGIYIIYELDRFKIGKKINWIITFIMIIFARFYDVIFTLVVTFAIKNILPFIPRRYIDSEYLYRAENNISSCNLVLYIVCAVLAVLLVVRKKAMNNFWYLIALLSLCGVFVGAKATFANRIFLYFQYLIIIMLGRMDIYPVKQTSENQMICNGMLYLMLIVYFYIFHIRQNISGIFPYSSVLSICMI